MARMVVLQFCVAFVVALVAGLVSSKAAAVSALAGGLCYAIPNALFALRLHLGTKKPGGASPGTFFVGEFLKMVLTIALLAAVVLLYRNVHWLAFLVGFIVVLKSYFILLLRS